MTTFGDTNSGIQADTINNGTFQWRAGPPELQRLETPPLPSVLIPFPRDNDFIERGTKLDQVQQICTRPGSRAALVGLGGVGKSQLAIEHAYRTREQSRDTWVLWVHASNAVRFEQSFRDIADWVKIAGRRDPHANIFKLVHDWLRRDCKKWWLLVLDNVDDAGFLLDAPAKSRPLREYLPYGERGSTLITTRSRETALKLVEERDIVIVEPMNEAEALLLFRKKLLAQEDSNDVVKLSAALEYMPLAIVQAAAYIIQRVPRYSTAKYLERFRKSEDKRTSLLKYGAGHLRRDWEANNSIIITWQISFEHIQQIRPAAANLLSLMSFFDPQGIPENLLRDRTGQGDTKERYEEFSNDDADSYGDDVSQSSASDEESEFEDDVLVLRNFCFISVDNAGTSFEMHALVQLATRNWLEAHNKFEKWNQQFIKILCAEFPEADYENWAMCQTLLAHAKLASKRQPKSRLSLVEWATLLHRAAWYSWMKGNAADAEELAMKSMETRQNILDPEHMDTLLAMGLVELAYKLGGQWHKAADSGRKNLEQSRKVLGEEHPITLAIIGNLATTYRYQGKWKDAEELEVKLVEMSKRVLGEKDSNTLAAIGNLASTYWHQGRCKEAEELNVKVMKTFSEMLGEEHPDTLTSMGNLASTYSDQGRCKEAEALFLQVIETSKRVLGDEHPSTLTFMASLASTYSDQGRCKEAENLLVEVIEKRKRLLGEQHPDTLTSIYHLAVVLNSQGRNAEAISLMDTSLERGKQVFGSLHPMILLCYEALDKWRGTNT